jgi:aryl-alcohol dehydrogenase-like predicted oxidoreductase
VKTVELGATGVRVSALCLGAMYLGTRTDRRTSFDLLDAYVEAGGSFIDTANIYAFWVPGGSGGESEQLLGEWMRLRRNRSRLFLATKVGFAYGDTPGGLSSGLIERECERSLRRLGIDGIDLYYAHVDDPATPMEESLEAMQRLVASGKVQHLGASNFTAVRLREAVGLDERRGREPYCCIQQRHTFLRPVPGASFAPQLAADDALLPLCGERRITLLAYSPLLGGAYGVPGKAIPEQYRGRESEARLQRLENAARELCCSTHQLVLAWLMQNRTPAIPLVAASTVEDLNEDLGAEGITLDAGLVSRLSGTPAPP